MNDQDFENRLRQTLESQRQEPDELTRAALRAARYRALDQLDRPARSWWPSALALASVLAGVLLTWQMTVPQQDLQLAANTSEDAAVIADLDLVLWLEDGEV